MAQLLEGSLCNIVREKVVMEQAVGRWEDGRQNITSLAVTVLVL